MKQWLKAHRNKITNIALITIIGGWAFFGIATTIGQYIEQQYYPVIGEQKIEQVTYNPLGCLCWVWHFDKKRAINADNVDVFITYMTKNSKGVEERNRVITSVFNGTTLVPFKLDANNPTGDLTREWCTFLPGGVRGHSPYHVDMTMRYPGFLGLWSTYGDLPDIDYTKEVPAASINNPEYVDPVTGENPYANDQPVPEQQEKK